MRDITEAVAVLQGGGVIAFPTETFYGLGALTTRPEALERLWRLKSRGRTGPLSLLISGVEMAERVVRPSALRRLTCRRLIERFWPGPLTLVLDAAAGVDERLIGPSGGVAIRVSSHPVANQLVCALGEPLTATSANLRGESPARSPEEIRSTGLDADLDLVVQGGETLGVLPSTVLRLFADRAEILREGAITREMLVEALAELSYEIG